MSASDFVNLAGRVFARLVPERYRDALVGDLVEEYNLRLASGTSEGAVRWFYRQLVCSLASIVQTAVLRGDWAVSLAVAVGVYITMAAFEMGSARVLYRFIDHEGMLAIVLAPIMFLAVTTAGGCIAARIRRDATTFLAPLVMLTVAVAIKHNACTVPVPWWYQFGFLTLGPLTVLLTPAVLPGHARQSVR
jgi:hypothetical protein